MKVNLSTLKRVVKNFLYLFYIFILIAQSHGMPQHILLGGKNGWNGIVSMNNTVFSSGRGGSPVILLKDSLYKTDDDTDLLIHFDTKTDNIAGNYTIVKGENEISHKYRIIGTGAGIFLNDGMGTRLKPGQNAFFASGNANGSFTIEFWLNPAIAAGNEEIISFRSSLKDIKGSIIPQVFTCTLEGRKLIWNFNNFFFNPESHTSHVSLTSIDRLIPGEWHHHMLIFDSSSGLLEYYLDNTLEGTTYTTVTHKENGAPFIPIIGSVTPGVLVLGRSFTGFMDEFRIVKRVVTKPILTEFQNGSGRITSKYFTMKRGGSKLETVTLDFTAPDNSAVRCYYRVFSDYKQILENKRQWQPFIPGSVFSSDNTGLFFEIQLRLFSNGAGTLSPEIHSLDAVYDYNLPPLAPVFLKAIAGNHSVELKWDNRGEPDIKGYCIYYGTKSKQYTGVEAQEGPSPLTIDKMSSYTLHGLKNGTLYYFSVAAFDAAGPNSPGFFSEEAYSRPGLLSDRRN